jgi:hypothetical protein
LVESEVAPEKPTTHKMKQAKHCRDIVRRAIFIYDRREYDWEYDSAQNEQSNRENDQRSSSLQE